MRVHIFFGNSKHVKQILQSSRKPKLATLESLKPTQNKNKRTNILNEPKHPKTPNCSAVILGPIVQITVFGQR